MSPNPVHSRVEHGIILDCSQRRGIQCLCNMRTCCSCHTQQKRVLHIKKKCSGSHSGATLFARRSWHCRQVRVIKMSSHSALPPLSPPKHLPCDTCGIETKLTRYLKWHIINGTEVMMSQVRVTKLSSHSSCTSSLLHPNILTATQFAYWHLWNLFQTDKILELAPDKARQG